ncbi:MAG: hypothetical protein IMHGJWDQ_002177 [Candidatus Fervidibacter sp.]
MLQRSGSPVWLVGMVVGTLSASWWTMAQPLPAPLMKPASVQGFADIVRASEKERKVAKPKEQVAESVLSSGEREGWAHLLQRYGLRLPQRAEGWKFAPYAWRRWRGALASRGGSVRRLRLMTMLATAYCPRGCCGSAHGRTATGRHAEYGIVAVDPRVIPLGTALYVDRYGFAIAADTGRKIKGARIDLCFPTHREASRFGRRIVRVLVLR